ncbi:MAG: aminoglycoside phosphotransferase family protein [Oscillospiraceae bacterium]|nr:aminoglycoside phosphotransferase family protein [Oscillospiraceae bacterium]
MKHPEKWRETIDPFSLPYKHFRPTEILGYPHAGNDVFHARGIYHGEEVTAFVKAARYEGKTIENEVALLNRLQAPMIPKVIDCGFDGTPFSVTLELPGERLSVIVGENKELASLAYMEEYGAALAKLHQLHIPAEPVKDRRFFHTPGEELLNSLGLEQLRPFFSRPPASKACCFCHGDFHYANILWKDGRLSGMLDFELAGYGNRDFDIAWAIFRRPGQKFLKTELEREAFLSGYSRFGAFDQEAVRFYMAQCYVYFLRFSGDDGEYREYAADWLKGIQS